MPFDASGNFTRLRGPDSWKGDAAAGTRIKSDLHDTNDNDIASGLSQCITKTGSTQPTADIPFAGKKITNLGDPVADTDAATKHYVDNLKTFTTGTVITGADLNGRVTFAGAGVTGLNFTTADLSWLARPTQMAADNVTAIQLPRLVLNSKADGSGSDVLRILDDGKVGTNWIISPNTSYDGSTWRAIAAGYICGINIGPTATSFYCSDTATTAGMQTATPRNFAALNGGNKYGFLTLNKLDGGACLIRGTTNNSIRWDIFLGESSPETGSQAGSNFGIYRYSDAGALIDTPISIPRNTGDVNIARNIFVNPNQGGVYAGFGIQGRSGYAGSYDGNWHNSIWTGAALAWYINNVYVGNVTLTCDYRIKKDVKPLDSTWDKVKALRPITYTTRDYSQNGETLLSVESDEVQWGFLAHELQEALLPSAATGTKDAENALQGPNLLAVVAALTSALQEAMVRIEALEARS